jgi:hypothetical protein
MNAEERPMGKNAEFVTNMDKMLVRWDKEVDLLARSAGNGAVEGGAAYAEGVKELREAREAAQKAFQEIRFAGESQGLLLKDGMQAAWVRMQSTLERVKDAVQKK